MTMIPKVIHYCWLSNDPYSASIEQCIASWRRNLSGYELCKWDMTRAPKEPWLIEAYDNKKYAFAADYIRFYALYHMGGIYLDADVEVFKSFDALLHNRSFIGYDMMGDIEAAVIGAEKGCAWIKECLDVYEGRHFKLEEGRFDMHTVPLVISKVLQRRYGIEEPNIGAFQHYDELAIFPSNYFSPKNLFNKKYKVSAETICVHHFEGQWVKKTPWLFMKYTIHRVVLFLFGQKVHNKLKYLARKLLNTSK